MPLAMNLAASSPNFMCGIGLDQAKATGRDFLFQLLFDGLGLLLVSSLSGLLVPDAVDEKIRPPDVAAFKQAHLVVSPPFVWLRSSGRLDPVEDQFAAGPGPKARKAHGMSFCLTVQGEQPITAAARRISMGGPRGP
jgi:hypothetical protein